MPHDGADWALWGPAPPPGMKMDKGERRVFELGKDALPVLTHGAHGLLEEAAAAPAPAPVFRTEAQFVGVVLVVRRG